MSLIKCKECGREISGTAENCPHCGYRTAHGRIVTEAKTVLVVFVLSVVAIVFGLLLFFTNLDEAMELYEGIAKYGLDQLVVVMKYRSSEFKKACLWNDIGLILIIVGIITMVGVKKKSDAIDKSGNNGFVREIQEQKNGVIRSYSQLNSANIKATNEAKKTPVNNSQRWECSQCHHTNPPAIQACTRCGAPRRAQE